MTGPIFSTCSTAEAQALHTAVRMARAKLMRGICGLSGLEPLRRTALAWLSGRRPLVVRCSDCEDVPALGFVPERPSGEMTLCRRLFADPLDRVCAVFFHELIHVCGGGELDSEGLECHCFAEGGATLPGASDYRLFRQLPARNGLYAGAYLLWHPGSGELFVRGPDGEPGEALNVRFLPIRK
ncbi:MAG: hypothetical protein JWN15_3068 [Firmicutes bacterium]|nr:hypothetical protein [Bacillota bacterium]